MSDQDKHFLLDELLSQECHCGRPKKSGNAFCYHCWQQLPNETQKALYKQFGQGYEEAYEEAITFLTD